jgi:hypothetical protein
MPFPFPNSLAGKFSIFVGMRNRVGRHELASETNEYPLYPRLPEESSLPTPGRVYPERGMPSTPSVVTPTSPNPAHPPRTMTN